MFYQKKNNKLNLQAMLWTLTIGSLNFFLNINMTNLNWTAVNIWKSYIWTADKDVNMKAIFAVMNTS